VERARGSLPVRSAALALAVVAGVFACESIIDTSSLQSGICPAGSKACNNKCVGSQDTDYHCADPTQCLPCDIPHATSICDHTGACAIGTCSTVTNAMGAAVEIWADCDVEVSDGCEVDLLHDPLNCGSCRNACSLPHVAEPGCSGGACNILECAAGYLDCDGNPRNGCESQADGGACPDAR
jgi:hypothetical protein